MLADSLQALRGGQREHPRLHRRPARLQRQGQAVSRHGDPPPAEHAVAQYGGGQEDHALNRTDRDPSGPIGRAWSGTAATAGRRRWDAEIAAACGRTWSCSSAGSCSPRSPMSWPATASTRAMRAAGARAAAAGRRRRRDRQLELRLVHLARQLDAQSGPVLNPDGSINNMALAPTGNSETRRAQAAAVHGAVRRAVQRRARPDHHPGDPDLDPGRRTANTMLHSDIQIRLVTPKDSEPADRRRQHDLRPQHQLQHGPGIRPLRAPAGRRPRRAAQPLPDRDHRRQHQLRRLRRGYAQGTINIHYIPSGKHTPACSARGRRSSRSTPRSTRPTPASSSATCGLNP